MVRILVVLLIFTTFVLIAFASSMEADAELRLDSEDQVLQRLKGNSRKLKDQIRHNNANAFEYHGDVYGDHRRFNRQDVENLCHSTYYSRRQPPPPQDGSPIHYK